MSRYRNGRPVSIPAAVGVFFAGFFFAAMPALAQRPMDPTDIGRVPGTNRFPPDLWRGVSEATPARPGSPRGAKQSCPLCGAPRRQDALETSAALDAQPADAVEPTALANYLKELLTRNVEEHRPATKQRLKTNEKLRPGEPAQVILELKERLGNGALEGTEFADSPDMLVKLVRALEAEQQPDAAIHEREWKYVREPQRAFARWGVEPRARIDALRGASGKLDQAANDLEEQDFFERADELRALAHKLRRDARAAVAAAGADAGAGADADIDRIDRASKRPASRRMKAPHGDAEVELSDDIEQLRDELRSVRQALETRWSEPRH